MFIYLPEYIIVNSRLHSDSGNKYTKRKAEFSNIFGFRLSVLFPKGNGWISNSICFIGQFVVLLWLKQLIDREKKTSLYMQSVFADTPIILSFQVA